MKALLVARREIVERVRSRVFVAVTLLGALCVLGLIFMPVIMDKVSNGGVTHIAVVDDSGGLMQALAPLQQAGSSGQVHFQFDLHKQQELDSLLAAMQSRQLDGVLVRRSPDGVDFHTFKLNTDMQDTLLKNAVMQWTVAERLRTQSVSAPAISAVFAPVDFAVHRTTALGKSASEVEAAQLTAYGLLMIQYMTLLFYGTTVAQGVAAEKSSRVIEVLVSSATPRELLWGKVLGIGAVALCQYITWIGVGIVGLVVGGQSSSLGPSLPDPGSLLLSPVNLLYFGLFFLLGFAMFASLYAGVGALATRAEDVPTLSLPISLFMVIALMVTMRVLLDPNSPLGVGLSFFPFLTPLVMFSRVLLSQPPLWQILVGIVEVVLTTMGTIWLAGKLYRTGMLHFGERITYKRLLGLFRRFAVRAGGSA